ncbi:hypothetical protein ASE73_07700 [Sphingomonas sp. Leaf24]|uniref:DUF6950 family protein n=1 Tax=unclassified Sphingomonas TaxID=196159 RepID=UPI0006F5C48E|nr:MULTISPECIES: hypothetical protein [unclassified Sphingomonas]KQM20197.1 hypothetical protein ASE50_16810 [Sphingomonas sp. Leaf5]KQM89460.1 hypothetical protein ASE73_07700 [Sphingomonas sp. Leaf24]
MEKPSELVRAPDWEERLAVYLDRKREEPFKWGSNDCALFAAEAIKAMTGTDPGEAFRGTYDSRTGSALALREHGEGTLLKTVTAWLGQPKHPVFAQRGDIVMKDRNTLGVCVGLHSWFVGEEHGQNGLVAVPTVDCTKAFSLPFVAAPSIEEVR